MAGKLVLNGGSAEKDLEFRKSEVEHLRRLLAWMAKYREVIEQGTNG